MEMCGMVLYTVRLTYLIDTEIAYLNLLASDLGDSSSGVRIVLRGIEFASHRRLCLCLSVRPSVVILLRRYRANRYQIWNTSLLDLCEGHLGLIDADPIAIACPQHSLRSPQM